MNQLTTLLLICLIFVAQGGPFTPRQTRPIIHQLKKFTEEESLSSHLSVSRDAAFLIPRGGEISLDEDQGNFVMKKVRNIVRSILKVSQKKAPILASVFNGVLGCIESVSGLHLLPRENEKKKKKDSKSKRARKEKSAEDKTATKKKVRASAQAKTHLTKELKTSNPNYRIQRELKDFLKSPPPNLNVKVGKNIRVWIVTMVGTKGSLYEGEKYRLRVQFPPNYPTEPPSVYFLQPSPRHEHVYTNGDICLSLLGKDWRPNMTAQSIAMSILSILSGAGRKSLPMDNAAHSQNKPGEKQDNWVYHDDNC
mmetsp:Transcript_13009/g.18990  ORF Transcript_13009/g.18990 Transcript_13009/m.18990 type:complete len:309 (-) Transcript_13009:23-949(-)